MGIVEQPIADGVGQRRLPEVVMPLAGWELARDDRRAATVAVFENLEEIAPLLVLHGGQAPVVEHEDVHAGELAQQLAVATIGAGELEVVEEPGGPAVVPRGSHDGRRGEPAHRRRSSSRCRWRR